jgi:hypothetical protein
MDKTTVVRSDLDTQGRVLNALSRAKIPASLVDLDYVPQLDEWQLVIATRLYDDKGPQEAYSRVIKALQAVGIYEEIPIRRVLLKSPSDPSVRALEAEVKVKTEGEIYIFVNTLYPSIDQCSYSVIFAPFSGPGGAIPSRRFDRLNLLQTFLEDEIGLSQSLVDETIDELKRKGSASVFHVQLTRREAKKLGLA